MKVFKHIPNTITSLNLLCGAIGVVSAFEGNLTLSFYLMIAAAVLDFFDGFAARMLNAYSPLGKELDSLADLISFGLLPAVMLNRLMVQTTGESSIFTYIPLVIAVFSALRLAKFNIDDSQTESFRGLPTPACAMIAGSFVHYIAKTPDSFLVGWISNDIFIPVASIVLAFLLVSNIPMFSMKFKKGGTNDTPVKRMRLSIIGVFCCCLVLIILLGAALSMAVLLTFLIYILINIMNLLLSR